VGKLIVHHEDRVTEHGLSDAPVVIGCDLFFADRKLSRQHARIEKDGTRFRLVDLASRNGSWVNEERTLQSGDGIRLGGMRVSFERSVPVVADRVEEVTGYLPSARFADDSATVMLEAPIEARTDATVALDLAMAEQDTLGPDDTVAMLLRVKADSELIARTPVHVSSEVAAATSGGNGPGEATTFYAPRVS
jgi:pSer/pThr/pTyr-binding forkhead associated (FHA) protein